MTDPGYVLGIDIGTSGVKVLAVDPTGQMVARGSATLQKPTSIGLGREQDASHWWAATATAMEEALYDLNDAGRRTDDIAAIAVDATSGTVVPVDQDMTPLHNGLMYNDGRAFAQAEALNIAGADVVARLGYRLNASFAAAKILWFSQTQPGIAERTSWYLHQSDVITSRLLETNHPFSDESNTLKTGYDIIERQWPAYLAKAGIDIGALPEVRPIAATLGTVGLSIASQFGLSSKCRIVAGMSDGTAACAASGAQHIGDRNTTLGTTIVWKMISGTVVHDPQGRLYAHRHPGGGFIPGGAGNAGGDGIRSMVEAVQVGAGQRLDELAAELDGQASSADLTYPAPARGERFPFVDAAFEPFTTCDGTDAQEQYLSALEGAGFIERWGYEVARDLGAECNGTVWTTGSGALVDPWMQIRADILGAQVCRAAVPESGFGSALVAAMNVWYDGDWTSAADAMIRKDRSFEPNIARQGHYSERYEMFREECARRLEKKPGQSKND